MLRNLKFDLVPAVPEVALSRLDRPGSPTAELVRSRVEEEPERVIVVEGDRHLSRRELYDKAVTLGSALMRRGLSRGSVVGFQLPNWIEACVISLACDLYGFVLCPLLPMYREREIGFILSQTRCEAVFIPSVFRNVDFPALLERVGLEGCRDLQVYQVRADKRAGTFEALLDETPDVVPPPSVPGSALRSVIFTSGTTGRPKGVLHTHDTMTATERRAAHFWGLTATDRLLIPSPIGHIGGSIYAFDLPWLTGATAYLMETWNAATAVALIDQHEITFCAGATPFLQGLLDLARSSGTCLPSLRRFICGGASVPPALVDAATRHFVGAVVSRAYGSTEVPLVCAGVRTRADALHGRATDGEVGVDLRIIDEDGGDVPPGAQGDVVVRSSGMFLGYLDTEDDVDQYTPDGFFRMGDIGRLVDDRYLEITGRRKELIIRMGENISPLEIENVLLSCAAIDRVAVVGIPNKRTGERAVAFVTLQPGHEFSLTDMQDFLGRAGLARQKFPEELHILSAIPTNAVGKVIKLELKRIAMGEPDSDVPSLRS